MCSWRGHILTFLYLGFDWLGNVLLIGVYHKLHAEGLKLLGLADNVTRSYSGNGTIIQFRRCSFEPSLANVGAPQTIVFT